MVDVNCWNNGSPWSMTQGQAYAACVKIAAAYTQGAGNFTLTNSYVHDQPGERGLVRLLQVRLLGYPRKPLRAQRKPRHLVGDVRRLDHK